MNSSRAARCGAAAVFALLAAACGPTYRVYNGGLSQERTELPATALELRPTEAAVAFTSDYAAPQENARGGGPTNRVQTDMPAQLRPHGFVAVYVSSAPKGVSRDVRAETAGKTVGAHAGMETAGARLYADGEAAGVMANLVQGASMGQTEGAARQGYSASKGGTQTSRNLQAPGVSDAATSRMSAQDVEGYGSSSAAVEPVVAQNTGDTGAAKGPMGYGNSEGGRMALAGEASRQTEVVEAAKQSSESDAGQTVASGGQPLDAGAAAAVERQARVTAPDVEKGAEPAGSVATMAAARGGEEEAAVAEFESPEYIVAETQAEGALRYRRFNTQATLVTIAAAEYVEVSEAGAGKEAARGSESYGDAAAAASGSRAENAAGASGARGLLGEERSRSNEMAGQTQSVRGEYKVSPPGLSVAKESAVYKGGALGRIVKSGILKEQPECGAATRYRIYVYNPTESVAVNVTLMDKLDVQTVLIADAVYTTSEDSKARYDAKTRALEVTTQRIEPGKYFIVEFYVELQAVE